LAPESRRPDLRYLPSEDRFVRILTLPSPAEGAWIELELQGQGPQTGADFRAAVVARFSAFEDPSHRPSPAAIDEIYGLVLEANPHLDPQSIRLLPAGPSQPSAPTPASPSNTKRLRRLARDVTGKLGQRVFGQPEALAALENGIQRAAVGFRERGPLASLLFVGPTGVGKTELARAVAAELDGEERLLRIDCSEYAEGHEYAKLLGSPPGYVGHQAGGQLAQAWRDEAPAVVLFDEIEKAHPQLHHLLLQVLDEGVLTDGSGQKLDFSQRLLLLTSNAGTRELEDANTAIGFDARRPGASARRKIVDAALGRLFRPELLARLDETVLFRELGPREARRIAQARLARLAVQVRGQQRRVRFSAAVAPWLAARGLAENEGARGVLRAIRRHVEGPLAQEILCGDGPGWLAMSVKNGKLSLKRA